MPYRILILDDEVDICQLLRYNLETRGYTTTCAGCAEDALELIRHQPFDLALVDLLLPGISGIEFCRCVRSTALYDRMFLVMLTAYEAKDHLINAIECGADMYLNKPFAPDDLIGRIQGLLSYRQRDSNAAARTSSQIRRRAILAANRPNGRFLSF